MLGIDRVLMRLLAVRRLGLPRRQALVLLNGSRMIVTLQSQTLLQDVLPLSHLQLLDQPLLLQGKLLQRCRCLLLVGRLNDVRLLDQVQLQLLLQLLYRLFQLPPSEFSQLMLVLSEYFQVNQSTILKVIVCNDLI